MKLDPPYDFDPMFDDYPAPKTLVEENKKLSERHWAKSAILMEKLWKYEVLLFC